MKELRSSSRTCPQCGCALARIPRRPEDRIVSQTVPIRRYRCCRLRGCGWEGTLVIESRRHRKLARQRVARLATIHFVLGALIGLTAVAVGAGVQPHRTFAPTSLRPDSAQTIPFGVSDFGQPLPEDHPFLQVNVDGVVRVPETASSAAATSQPGTPAASSDDAPLSLRDGCAWGEPGRNPYTGTVRQALKAAQLPADVVVLLETKIRDRQASDRLEIRNDQIRGVQSGAAFESRAIKMTYGKTLCLNSRVNFVPGHVERADLYEVTDARGVTYSVMVPYVCGNISVLAGYGKSDGTAGRVLGGNVGQGPTRGGQGVQSLVWGTRETAPLRGNSIPEPKTWALILGGLALLGWFTRRH